MYLMKGLVNASRVRINQEGWTIIKDFRFFLNLIKTNRFVADDTTMFNNDTLKHFILSLQGVILTFCQSADNTFWASQLSASFSERSHRLNTLSYSFRRPTVPVCQWHICSRGLQLANSFKRIANKYVKVKFTPTWTNCPWCICNLVYCSLA